VTELLEFISSHFSPAWGTAAAGIVVAYVALLGLARLFEVWRSFRTRRAVLEEEKLFAEILKITYEIEALRKNHGLPELPPPVERPAKAHAHSSGRHGFSLPEIPAFSFAPVVSLFAVRWRRPEPGLRRSFWAVKVLLAVVAVFCICAAIIASLPPRTEQVAGAGLVILGTLAAAYLILICLVNLLRAFITAVGSRGKDASSTA
jgi:hypothetical protein